MKITETIMQGIKTTESINTEMILTCRLITITYTHNNMYVIQYKLMCIHGCQLQKDEKNKKNKTKQLITMYLNVSVD